MVDIHAALSTLAAHPITIGAYRSIRLARHDDHGRPLYIVLRKEVGGADLAMRAAHDAHGSSCFYCGKPMCPGLSGDMFTLDHVLPKSRGGTDDLHNLVFCCLTCNARKANRHISDFHPERAKDYSEALDRHYLRCLALVTGRPMQPAFAVAA